MKSRARGIIAAAGAVGSAVTAGVYILFSAKLMPDFRRMSDVSGILKMQQFNRDAVQPPFMICFFGGALAGVYLVASAFRGRRTRWDLVAATGGAFYLLGFGLTIAYNVPLNDQLAAVNAHDPSAAQLWHDYLNNWTNANSVRAVLSAIGAALLIAGAVGLIRGRGQDVDGKQHFVPAPRQRDLTGSR
ncbi:DUF1772 domain-containing protein [Flexivirga meconopsidis]|uniref:anthrone oxygenase family protein n=1 Tax=Flexivirga meconopsidis TaxID=2977121 RepID=UPI00223FC5B2|nr:anthrone oxygenase family protein [Flexivirga meconopsidis]